MDAAQIKLWLTEVFVAFKKIDFKPHAIDVFHKFVLFKKFGVKLAHKQNRFSLTVNKRKVEQFKKQTVVQIILKKDLIKLMNIILYILC